MSDDENEPTQLNTVAPVTSGLRAPLGAEYGINELAELVADLLSSTELVPEDKLAITRGRARQTG